MFSTNFSFMFLQEKLKELEDVKRERDEVNEQLKALKTQKDDLAQKGRKVETERNDFLMNNKLMQQQKENLEARNTALQRTNDTFKTKVMFINNFCVNFVHFMIAIEPVVLDIEPGERMS